MLGVMIDCSRNAVMTVNAVKGFADIISEMGYDTIMLYTEDTFEVNNEPYFGYMRGRYSKSEIKEIDAYCAIKGIELIPCIQTLAHLNGIFQVTDKYYDIKDCDDILLVENQRTYELIENMISTVSECFSSKKIHIGMDEAEKVGLGKYLRKNGYNDRFELINRHLHKVCEIAEKYGFEPMIWSDMFCRLAQNSGDYHAGGDLSKIKEKAALPKNVTLAYWDYYSDDVERYTKMIEMNQAFDRPVLFAGGAWTWKGFTPDNALSIKNSVAAIKACNDCGVKDIIITMWGDDGAECSRLSVLPSLMYIAEMVKGNFDEESIKAKFSDLIGIDFDDYMLLDAPNNIGGEHNYNPSKYLLYNDVFMGLNDYRVSDSDSKYYSDLAEKLRSVSVNDNYKNIFNTQIALCEALAAKVTLGIKTRMAYKERNRKELKRLAENDYMLAIEKLENLHKELSIQWHAENKPFGFDIQDFRFGGLIQRYKSCIERLIAFANEDISCIEELEAELLKGDGKLQWSNIATPNVITHMNFS